MSTKHIRSAADLVRFKSALKVECGRCGNSRTMTGLDVVKQFGTAERSTILRRQADGALPRASRN
jgi:hypothetical protein